MVNMKFLKSLAKGLLYIILNIIFIFVFPDILNRLRDAGELRFNILILLPIYLFPLVISFIFSFEHIKRLFLNRNKKLTIKITNIVIVFVTLFLIVSMHLPRFMLTEAATTLDHTFLGYLNILNFTFYGRTIISFALWYNLIHAFNRDESSD